MADQARPGMVESVVRATHILQMLASHNERGLRLSDVAAASTLSNSTAHRLIRTLMMSGFVEQDATTRRYYVGFSFLALGVAATKRLNLVGLARKSLERLALASGDTVFLSIQSGLEAVFVDRIEGSYPIKTVTATVGARRPLGYGAGPLALLAGNPDDRVKEIIAKIGRKKVLPSFITPDDLFRAVHEVRRLGYSLVDGVILRGMSTIGMAILNENEETIGAISIAAVRDRMNDDRRSELLVMLKAETQNVSREVQRYYPRPQDGISGEDQA